MQKRRIKRDFRQWVNAPARFLAFCKKVLHALTAIPGLPESVLVLLKPFAEMVAKFETIHHLALDGGRTLIREREKLSEEIVVLLDQMASTLESVYMLNPDALLTTGFTVTQERRVSPRVKLPLIAPLDFNVVNSGERGKALATASTFPGALVHEIHISLKDPSIEENWLHKAIFPDSQTMLMENLEAGNTYFRMRHFGQEGPGPWSAVITTTIT